MFVIHMYCTFKSTTYLTSELLDRNCVILDWQLLLLIASIIITLIGHEKIGNSLAY